MVGTEGLEPLRIAPQVPKTCASAISPRPRVGSFHCSIVAGGVQPPDWPWYNSARSFYRWSILYARAALLAVDRRAARLACRARIRCRWRAGDVAAAGRSKPRRRHSVPPFPRGSPKRRPAAGSRCSCARVSPATGLASTGSRAGTTRPSAARGRAFPRSATRMARSTPIPLSLAGAADAIQPRVLLHAAAALSRRCGRCESR